MMKKWLVFIIHSHLFLSISTFVFSRGILNPNSFSINFSWALSFAVYAVYNLNRLNKLRKNQLSEEMRFWYDKNAVILRFSAFFCLVISVFLFVYLFRQNPFSLILLAISGLITAFYIFTIKQANIRQIPGTKAIWIAIVWTSISVILPKMTLGTFLWTDLHYFILFLALTIPGDLRDLKIDKPEIKTIPQLIGKQKATMLFFVSISMFLLLNCYFEHRNLLAISPVFLCSLILFQKRIPFRYELMDGMLLVL